MEIQSDFLDQDIKVEEMSDEEPTKEPDLIGNIFYAGVKLHGEEQQNVDLPQNLLNTWQILDEDTTIKQEHSDDNVYGDDALAAASTMNVDNTVRIPKVCPKLHTKTRKKPAKVARKAKLKKKTHHVKHGQPKNGKNSKLKHSSSSTSSQPTRYKCTIDSCGKSYKSKKTLAKHLQSTHDAAAESSHYNKTFNNDCTPPKPEKSVQDKANKCDMCEKRFKTSSALKTHKQTHLNNYKYSCDYCERKFQYKTEYISHTTTHTGIKNYECALCQKRYCHSSGLAMHRRICGLSEKPFACQNCPATFKLQRYLKYHQQVKHNENPPQYKCPLCERSFIHRASLRNHRIANHAVFPKANPNHPDVDGNSNGGEGRAGSEIMSKKEVGAEHNDERQSHTVVIRPTYTCPFENCEKTFHSKNGLLKHKHSHTGTGPKCEACGTMYCSPYELKKHIESVHENKKWPCDLCNAVYKSQTALRLHKMEHFNIYKFSCSFCERKFQYKSTYTAHLAGHTGIKQYTCLKCNRKFSSSSTVRQHETICGVTSRPFLCSMCPATFKTNRYRREHEKSRHDKSQSYQCSKCGECFNFRYSLYSHETRKHGEHLKTKDKSQENKASYKCTFENCTKVYNRLSGLRRHERGHLGTGPRCEVCNKMFLDNHSLKCHQESTHENKLWMCNICAHTFKTASGLKLHQREHMNLYKYSCQHCEQKFNYKSTYESHVAKHTGDKLYNCKKCEKSFAHVSTLRKHESGCGSSERNYTCTQCPAKFKLGRTLKDHMNVVHKNPNQYHCDVCDFHFQTKQAFNNHFRSKRHSKQVAKKATMK